MRTGSTSPTPVAVTWDRRRRAPVSFTWRRRRWHVEREVQTWVIDTGWWRDEIRVSRRYSRVLAEGRLFDLYFDRLTKDWFLEKALN
jgi:hypothetical protein